MSWEDDALAAAKAIHGDEWWMIRTMIIDGAIMAAKRFPGKSAREHAMDGAARADRDGQHEIAISMRAAFIEDGPGVGTVLVSVARTT